MSESFHEPQTLETSAPAGPGVGRERQEKEGIARSACSVQSRAGAEDLCDIVLKAVD